MSAFSRRILAAVGGLVTIVIAAWWTLIAGSAISRYVWGHLALNVPLSQAKGPRPDVNDDSAQLVYLALVAAIIMALGASVSLKILTPRAGWNTRVAGYGIVLLALLPATLYNYFQKDNVLPMGLQVAFNVVLIFLGSVAAWWVAEFRVSAPDGRILKLLVLILLATSAVFVPTFFTLLWGLNQVGILTAKQTRGVEFSHITGAAAIGSLVISWLNYNRERRKEKAAENAANSRIILK